MKIFDLLTKLYKRISPERFLNNEIRERLKSNFGIESYWYPLFGESKPIDLEYFDTDVLEEKYGRQKTINLIKILGDEVINEINEGGDDEKIRIEKFGFSPRGRCLHLTLFS